MIMLSMDGSRHKGRRDRKGSESNNLPDAGEVFVPVSNQKEASRVHNMNTQQGKHVIKSRMKDLEQQGSLEEGQFTHVKQDLAMKANKQMFDGYKK